MILMITRRTLKLLTSLKERRPTATVSKMPWWFSRNKPSITTLSLSLSLFLSSSSVFWRRGNKYRTIYQSACLVIPITRLSFTFGYFSFLFFFFFPITRPFGWLTLATSRWLCVHVRYMSRREATKIACKSISFKTLQRPPPPGTNFGLFNWFIIALG